MDNLEITDGQILPSTICDTQRKLEVYIQRFVGLCSSDPQRAYDLLSKNEKNKFNDYNDFKNNSVAKYNHISTFIKEYEQNKRTYDITDDKENKIKIVETRSMRYTIEFE